MKAWRDWQWAMEVVIDDFPSNIIRSSKELSHITHEPSVAQQGRAS